MHQVTTKPLTTFWAEYQRPSMCPNVSTAKED